MNDIEMKAVETVVENNKEIITDLITKGTSREKIIIMLIAMLGTGAALVAIEWAINTLISKKMKKEEVKLEVVEPAESEVKVDEK